MVLILLLAVIVSGFLTRLSPLKLPLPLIQIAVGAILAYVSGFEVSLDPEIFFLLFVPPLLFLDGWRIPKDAFFHDLRPILALAVGLVVFTVIGMGLFVGWLIPAVPLAAAFALAAILSPTDPVAVSAITSGTPIPSRLMHILEGEALLNDASGLVCFRFAVAAALTGSFSLTSASWNFVLVAGGGIVIGTAVSWAVNLANKWLVRMVGEEPGIQILISLLVPFTAYLAAEHLHASGILAAVAAGITMHHADLTGHRLAATRMQRGAVWDTVQVTLNGAIFIVLGEQLPRILTGASAVAAHNGISHSWHLAAYVIVITLMLTVLRFVWVWASLKLTLFGPRRESTVSPRSFRRMLLVTAFAGVKGTITLAGILALPITMMDGTAFPARDLLILLATGVILMSLITASIALPLLASGIELAAEAPLVRKESKARSAAAEAAIRRIERVRDQPSMTEMETQARLEASVRVIDLYRRRVDNDDVTGDETHRMQAVADAERKLRIEALHAERDELYQLLVAGQIGDTLHRRLVREIDLIETALSRQQSH